MSFVLARGRDRVTQLELGLVHTNPGNLIAHLIFLSPVWPNIHTKMAFSVMEKQSFSK